MPSLSRARQYNDRDVSFLCEVQRVHVHFLHSLSLCQITTPRQQHTNINVPELGDVILTLRGSGQTYDEYELQKEFEDGRSLVCRRTTPDIDEHAKVILKLAPGFKVRSALHLAVRITVNYGDQLVVHDQILERSQVQTATTRGIQLAGLISLPTPIPTGQEAERPSHSWTWRKGIVCVSVTRGSAGSDRTVQDMSAKTWEAKVKKTQRTPPNGWITYCPGWASLASESEGTMLSFEIRPPGTQ
ncbi:hypothetical protein LTR15_000174 [Elasticomyces elasticus]|nr:hypothetical protein LTR15_000174 [Elasticomyces elasticus]